MTSLSFPPIRPPSRFGFLFPLLPLPARPPARFFSSRLSLAPPQSHLHPTFPPSPTHPPPPSHPSLSLFRWIAVPRLISNVYSCQLLDIAIDGVSRPHVAIFFPLKHGHQRSGSQTCRCGFIHKRRGKLQRWEYGRVHDRSQCQVAQQQLAITQCVQGRMGQLAPTRRCSEKKGVMLLGRRGGGPHPAN